ncbi:MAG: twin-arginine translocation signal domain-containing protein [Dehalococcoidia bacterium]|nr:twin-arginine translocation signal domain-containing protein [Dehalococcoidia bacterium]MSQ17306.1 twin-arginine translocation signal domain-containing protein [Dehalococcoidia bacterium]
MDRREFLLAATATAGLLVVSACGGPKHRNQGRASPQGAR